MITVNKVGEYLIDLITSYILVQTMNLKNLLLKGLPAAVQTELSDERLAKHLYKWEQKKCRTTAASWKFWIREVVLIFNVHNA